MAIAKIGLAVFVLVFLLISPASRNFIGAHIEQINALAPLSYIALLLVVVAPIAAMIIINTWPKRAEPEDPMAKYRNQEPAED